MPFTCKYCKMVIDDPKGEYNTTIHTLKCGECLKSAVYEDVVEKHDYSCGDLMTIEDFMDCCEAGGFIDSDGFGELATANATSNREARPSAVMKPGFKTCYTHIMWYNK